MNIPSKVEVKIDNALLAVKGPKGELSRTVPAYITLKTEDNMLFVSLSEAARVDKAGDYMRLWGLERALIQNMLIGVSQGFSKSLELQGVGYKAAQKGSDIELNLGFSHPVLFPIPQSITVTIEKNIVTLSGIDRELVGATAAKIRALKVPEPYKGHGVRYVGEVIRLKAGKKAVATSST